MKKELISQLFGKKWNYAWSNEDNHVIGLYYTCGGFKGLLEMLETKKQSMKDFNYYYSSDLIETLQKLVALAANNVDFESYIKSSSISYQRHNLTKLKEFGYLHLYKNFDSYFNGIINKVHSALDFTFIETMKDGNLCFFLVEDDKIHNSMFNSLEQALVYVIFKGNYTDTLFTLLEIVKDETK